jgi:hypothetical protein
MRLRHPGLTIETTDGEELSFFQLKDLAQSEMHAEASVPGSRRLAKSAKQKIQTETSARFASRS